MQNGLIIMQNGQTIEYILRSGIKK